MQAIFDPCPVLALMGRAATANPPCPKQECVFYGWRDPGTEKFCRRCSWARDRVKKDLCSVGYAIALESHRIPRFDTCQAATEGRRTAERVCTFFLSQTHHSCLLISLRDRDGLKNASEPYQTFISGVLLEPPFLTLLLKPHDRRYAIDGEHPVATRGTSP